MSDERSVEHNAFPVPSGMSTETRISLPFIQTVHGEPFQIVRLFQDAVGYAKSPLLQEAASLAINILATSQISGVEAHDAIARKACLMAYIVLTEPKIDQKNIKGTVDVLRRAEFLVKRQASSHWCNRGVELQVDAENKVLIDEISEMLWDLQHLPVNLEIIPEAETAITDSRSTLNQYLPHIAGPPKDSDVKKNAVVSQRPLLRYLLQAYLLVLLDLPKFYASRITTWRQSTDHLYQTHPSKNAANSISRVTLDEQCDEYDAEFCDRAFTTLLREWKTLRVLASIVFASVLAMLQISRVETDATISTPAYFSLISGIMAAVSATVLDLYFQSGRLSPSSLAWIDSLRRSAEPKYFSDGSVVLALPAISTAWCTIMFIISIVAFAFKAYTGSADQEPDTTTSVGASLVLRILLSIFILVSVAFLAMILVTLRTISKGRQDLTD
ncbi:hypothetical protein P691DRAFT_774594 [Macrolepiota fuliginosa MF-IS2]|uniref:Uncharacterized protein n=1 Tax=Macrolepiota fuliginosa MF-IS2 TaxID=1400762 RepID=A0A9P6C5V7_9AGAR|nr:hypothetical protein P691DRAFT_774594 [Macrolepiota fuliginosa MF-IS2]